MTDRFAGRRCLILGAGGFIGGNLALSLVRQGAEVRAFGRRRRDGQDHGVADWIDADFSDRAALGMALEGISHVFHLLGGSNPAANNAAPLGEIDSNVTPSLALFDACCAAGIEKLVYVSSGGTVYGPNAGVPTSEDAPTDPITAYGAGKLAVEKFLRVYQRHHGLDYCILRVANPFGPLQPPGRGQGFIAHAMHSALQGASIELWGDGSVVRDFVFIDDVVDAILAAGDHHGKERLFNIGSGVGRSLNAVIEDVGRVAGSPLAVRRIAARPADVPVSVLDCSRAAEHLHWRAETDWDRALQQTRAWLEAR